MLIFVSESVKCEGEGDEVNMDREHRFSITVRPSGTRGSRDNEGVCQFAS